MKRILLLIFSLCITGIYGQSGNKTERIDKLVADIASENKLMSEGVGIGGIRPEQYDRFDSLKTIASENDLRRLTRHDNAVVRCYAFWALADQQSPGLFPILREHLQDTARVDRMFGCIVSSVAVADFYIELLVPRFLITEDYYRENPSQLSSAEKSQLDSMVLYQEIALAYRNDVLRDHTPRDADYNRIRELVLAGMHVALPALARYRKKEDRELILSFRENMEGNGIFTDQDESLFSAIVDFPDDYFLPFLEDHGRQILKENYFSSSWATFYEACAVYDRSRTRAILERAIRQKMSASIKERHLEFIAGALGKFPSAQNQTLIAELWRDHKHLSPEAFTYLSRQDRELTFRLLVPYLEAFDKNHRTVGEERLVHPMVWFLIDYDREVAVQLIAANLRTSDIPYFEEFVPFVRLLKAEAFIEPLIYRIEREWNGYIVFDAIEALLVYDRPELEERILPASRKNEAVVDQYFSRAELERTIREMLAKK